jgi:uncharacterized protein (DUF58 family)
MKKDPVRIYILPTRFGLFLSVWAVILFFAQSQTHFGEGALAVLAFIVVLGVMAMHMTHANLAALDVESLRLAPGFAGESSQLRIQYKNVKNLALLSLDIGGHAANFGAGAEGAIHTPFELERRGTLDEVHLKISTVYPLGLFYAWRYCDARVRTHVYPARDPALAREFDARADLLEETGESEELRGHREYLPGDPLRSLDWKALAKTSKTLAKLYDSRKPAAIQLSLDTAPGSGLEDKLRYLSTAVDCCRRREIPVGLVLAQRRIGAAADASHYVTCLEALAEFPDAKA